MAKILILDDNETILKIISSVLSSAGHQTDLCRNPIDAVELLKREKFNIIITDLMLPGGTNGFDFIKTVRKYKEFDQTPIIVITGQRRETKDVHKAVSAGANDFIVKPIQPEILIKKVETLLNSHLKSRRALDYVIVDAKGLWDMIVDIVKVTETGMEVVSPVLIPIDAKVRLNSDFFQKEIGIESPWLKVTNCAKNSSRTGYNISVKFVEMTEKQTGPLKEWLKQATSKAS